MRVDFHGKNWTFLNKNGYSQMKKWTFENRTGYSYFIIFTFVDEKELRRQKLEL